MKWSRSLRFLLLAAAIAAGASLGCTSPLQDRYGSGAAATAGATGATAAAPSRLVLSIAGAEAAKSAAKTIVPGVSGLVVSYSALLQKGSSSRTAAGASSPLVVEGLEPGTWSLTVSGLDASGHVLAQGSAAPVVGANQTVTASVSLAFIQSGGTGGIDITLSFPPSIGIDAASATLGGSAIAPSPSVDTSDPAQSKVLVSLATVASGSPLLKVFLMKGGAVLAGVTESVWVFQNVTTKATIALQASDFGAPPSAPTGLAVAGAQDGSLLLSWGGVSIVADAYIVRRSAAAGGPFAQVGGDLAYDAAGFADSGLAAGTTYYYQVAAKNRFGESASASASGTTFSPVAAPTIAPASGSYPESQSASLSCGTPGAAIYYTLDGTPPSSSSIPYTAPIPLSAHGSALTIRAVATMSGMANSSPASATYSINRKPAISAFTASPASVYRGQVVTLATTASDPDSGDVLSYSYSAPAGIAITGSGASVTATSSALGTKTIAVTVDDGHGNQATASVNVVVVNRSPSIDSFASDASPLYLLWNTTVFPNVFVPQTKTLTFSASDSDGDVPLSYSYSLVSGAGTVSGNGTTATYTTSAQTGTSTVRAIAADSQGATASLDVQIKVCGWNSVTGLSTGRYGHSAIYDGVGSMIVFGGYVGGMSSYLQNDLLQFDVASSTWTPITPTPKDGPPGARAYHSAIYRNGKMVIFGGQGASDYYKDVWEYDLAAKTWTQLPSNPGYGASSDVGVYNHSAVYDGANMIVFGGLVYNSGGTISANNQVWQYSFSTGGWTQLSQTGGPPAARFAHSAVYGGDGNMLVFGGRSSPSATTYYNDVWMYGIASNTWTQLVSSGGPAVRYGHCAIYDGKGLMVIFAGLGAGWYKDVWLYNVARQTWTAIPNSGSASPSFSPIFVGANTYQCAVYDGKGKMIICGGINSGIPDYQASTLILP